MPRGWRSWRGGRSRSMIWPRRSSKEGAAEGGSSLNLSASAADCNTEQVSTGGRCTCPHMQRWLCWIFLLRPAYSNGFIEVTLTDLYRHLGWTQHCPRRPVKELKQHLSCTCVFFQQGAELTATQWTVWMKISLTINYLWYTLLKIIYLKCTPQRFSCLFYWCEFSLIRIKNQSTDANAVQQTSALPSVFAQWSRKIRLLSVGMYSVWWMLESNNWCWSVKIKVLNSLSVWHEIIIHSNIRSVICN